MAYYSSPMSDMSSAYSVDGDELIRVRMGPRGTSDISLFPRCNISHHSSQTESSFKTSHIGTQGVPLPQEDLNDPTDLDAPYEHTKHMDHMNFHNNGYGDFDNCDPELYDLETVGQSESSESQACYGTENIVRELKPEYVRWFYKYDGDSKWTPFTGYDSLLIETRYRCEVAFNLGKYEQGGVGSNEINPEYDKMEASPIFDDRRHGSSLSEIAKDKLLSMKSPSSSRKWLKPWYQAKLSGSSFSRDQFKDTATGDNPLVNAQNATASNNTSTSYKVQTDYGRSDELLIVRGGLYEVDMENCLCTATYWPGDTCSIIRGTWFYDGTWQPLHTKYADRLEEEHLGKFAGVSLVCYNKTASESPESPTKKNRNDVVHRVTFPEFHVDWASPTEIYMYSKAASYKFVRSVGQRLGINHQTWGHRICRGYFKQADAIDRPSEISQIIFVVHGIGQKMEKGRIVRNCATFRDCVAKLKERYFPHLKDIKHRAEFFPVEWRSGAKLDGDIVDSITPLKLASLRQMLNTTAMDIMYYTSPLYRTEIQDALRNELNRIYTDFVSRNPHFIGRGGTVSVIAHSLGAVITYDIITGYDAEIAPILEQHQKMMGHIPVDMYDRGTGTRYARDSRDDYLFNRAHHMNAVSHHSNRLLFQVEHFFCIGSPLSVFLALRYKEPQDPCVRHMILPPSLCKRIYNIFHPSDPVAYRMEPLLNKEYAKILPLSIHAYNTAMQNPIRYDRMPRNYMSKDKETKSDNTNPVPESSAKSTPHRSFASYNLKSPPTPYKDNWGWLSFMKYWKPSENMTESPPGSSADIGPDFRNVPPETVDLEDLNEKDEFTEINDDLDYRLDYVLREGNLTSSYFAAITSHTSYWSSPDAALFVLTHLYDEDLEILSMAEKYE